jgi:SRSO17 transposase
MEHELVDGESRFEEFVESLVEAIGHADRAVPLRHYCVGLFGGGGP